MAAFVSLIALVVSVVTACVAVQQHDRVTEVEQKMIEMKMHFERLLNEYDYEIYDYDDPKVGDVVPLLVPCVLSSSGDDLFIYFFSSSFFIFFL